MNDIKMGTQWVNRNNGRWVTVVATLASPVNGRTVERVRISDGGREIHVPRSFFNDTFILVDDPDHPYPGETWSVGYEVVTIVTVSDGWVVYRPNGKSVRASHVDDFLVSAERGAKERQKPSIQGVRGDQARFFPVWESKGENSSDPGFINADQAHGRPEEIVAKAPWRCLGIVRIPLDWDAMEWIEWPK